jgi:hypothetical protein
LHLDRTLTTTPGGSSQAADLGHARPREMSRQASRRLQSTMLATAVPLVARFSGIQFELPPSFTRRGKKPAEIPPRSRLSARADSS